MVQTDDGCGGGVLLRHFALCQELETYAAGAVARAVEARLKRRHFDELPEGANTLGGVIAFLFEKLRLKHHDIALLRWWRERPLPMLGDREIAAHAAIRKAYSEHKRSRLLKKGRRRKRV
jgi:hypothetical protein